MATRQRKRGTIASARGKLSIQFYWIHPDEGATKEYRWTVATQKEDTESNRLALERRLESINSLINANAFFPCQEFPGAKIASYCRCPTCLTVSPLSQSHIAPATLKELIHQYKAYSEARAHGDKRVIERNTLKFKLSILRSFENKFTFLDPEGALYEFAPLTDYAIRELTPEEVKDWLTSYQYRQERIKAGKRPNTTKRLRDMLSELVQALEFGRYKRYWKNHPLLDFQGTLIQSSKEEKNRQMNALAFKPFTLEERDLILNWLRNHYESCPETKYKGKERLRRFFIYHYCVIAFNTGLRSPSEMTGLEWSSINFNTREIHVCQTREATGRIEEQVIKPYTKTVKHRYVPINQMAFDSLKQLYMHRQEENDAIFWNPRAESSNPFLTSNGWAPLTGEKRIRHTFNQALAALKIRSEDQQGQYRMRHTFTTLILDHTNFSDAKVAALIGDNVETMKKHYAGFCHNRWKNETDISQMDVMNTQAKRKLKVVKS